MGICKYIFALIIYFQHFEQKKQVEQTTWYLFKQILPVQD